MTYTTRIILVIIATFFRGQNVRGSVWDTTECKKCPYNLCTNTKIYDNPDTAFTCWTTGTDIYSDTYDGVCDGNLTQTIDSSTRTWLVRQLHVHK